MIIPLLLGPRVLRAQEAEIDQLASNLAAKLQKSREKLFPHKVVVMDFPLRAGGMNALGQFLADELSDALVKNGAWFQVVARKDLRNYLQANLLSPLDLQDRDIAIWSAQQVGAGFVVSGSITPGDNAIALSIELVRSSDGKRLGDMKSTLPMVESLRELLNKPLEWPPTAITPPAAGIVVSCSAGHPKQTANLFKAAGVSLPKCIRCPIPEYTEEARKYREQGSVKVNVVVGADGRPTSIYLVKPARYGFNERAVEAVRTWQFQPAMRNGKPTAVCVTVEVTFKLF